MKTAAVVVLVFACAGICLSLNLAGVSAAPEKSDAPAVKWEYKVLLRSAGDTVEELEKDLNKLGQDGWELTTTTYVTVPGGGGVQHVLRRPKR